MAFIALRPASKYLPRSWALALADAAGLVICLSPIGARARRSLARAFPSHETSKLARQWLTLPFRDFVVVNRIAAGADIVGEWPVESRGAPAILSDPGQSVIVATGHFARQAVAPIYLASVIPKRMSAVVAAVDASPLGPRALRVRVQFGPMVDAIRRIREGDIDMVEVGAPGVVNHVLDFLKQPGSVAVLSSDVPWSRSQGLRRPFAGHASLNFALGTARLARMSQRPVVTCVPFLDADGHIVLEWSEPIPAPAKDDRSADARVTGQILDIIERGVGRRPEQYVLSIGEGRSWDPATETWIAREDAPQADTNVEASAELAVQNREMRALTSALTRSVAPWDEAPR